MRIKENSLILLFVFFSIYSTGKSQINYPFFSTEGNRDIQAFWYNIPKDTTEGFFSSLHVYGKAPSESFRIEVKVYSKTGDEVFNRIFSSKIQQSQDSYSIEFNQGFFKLVYPVEYLKQNPDRIIVSIKSANGDRVNEIKCYYHRLFGKVTDFKGNPFKAIVSIRPDAFGKSGRGIATRCDQMGNYEIELPERTYNSIWVDDESYGITTLEAWGWHIIVDSNQRLDFKVGTGEVYNLNVWPNNGGYHTYFISFRPMVLFPQKVDEKKYNIVLNENEFKITDIAPVLEIEDLSVSVNGKQAKIISVQNYYETGNNEKAMPAYLVQIDRRGLDKTGKQTVALQYEIEMEIGGKKVLRNAMGIFQFYLNYAGLSKYF